MFTLSIAIQQLVTRQNQPEAYAQITLRFGTLQTIIQLVNAIGGKRIILDLNHSQLCNMLKIYSFGLFFTNQKGKYFSLLNLQNLVPDDKISGQEVYFYNDLQEIIYTAKLSINFIQYKNPKIPNVSNIKNHKKLDDYFHKPEVPHHQIAIKTLNTFLYGNKRQQGTKNNKQVKMQKPGKKANMKKTHAFGSKPQKQILAQNFAIKSKIEIIQDQNQNQDGFPPPMQFVNRQQPSTPKLTQQLLQVNHTSPEWMKAQKKQRNIYSQTLIKTFNKYKNDSGQNKQRHFQNKNKNLQTVESKNINRNQLRDLAKRQIENYQGKNNIKIPISKNGKLQLVQLKDLSEEQILEYVQQQKRRQSDEKQKQFMRKLQQKERQNKQLKQTLEKQKIKNKQNQMKAYAQKVNNSKKSSFTSVKKYDEISEEPDYEQNSQKQKVEQYDYESDFQSMSIGNSQIKSRISVSQKKQKQQSSANYEEYEQDFQSFSQSQLNYSQRKSNSDISQSWRSSLYRK